MFPLYRDIYINMYTSQLILSQGERLPESFTLGTKESIKHLSTVMECVNVFVPDI